MPKKGMQYDYKKAYDKNLKPSARLHYLENARHDQDSGSPNNFLGGITAGIVGAARGGALNRFLESSLGQAAQQAAGAAPVVPVAPTADVSAGAAMSGGTMDPTNPFAGKTFQITPANMMGNAKPTFNEQTQGMAQTVFGSGLERQMSMPKAGTSAISMKDIPKGDEGAGLRALPNNVVEQMGYDAATKMVSPLNDNHPGDKKMLRRAASVLTGGLSEVAAEVVQRVKDYNNTPQQTFTKVKTDMPRKRANGGHPGYVVNINTGERHFTETIPQAQNILKKQPQNILKKNK